MQGSALWVLYTPGLRSLAASDALHCGRHPFLSQPLGPRRPFLALAALALWRGPGGGPLASLPEYLAILAPGGASGSKIDLEAHSLRLYRASSASCPCHD